MRIQEKYKIEQEKNTPLKSAIDKYMRLKYNENYINKAEELAKNICEIFEENYPKVDFEFRYRIKSDNSLKKKLLKLESERLEDLFFLDKISQEQMEYFHEIMIKKFKVFVNLDNKKAEKKFQNLINEKEINSEKRKERSIENLKEKNRNPLNPDEYLQLFDIVGMKIVINEIPQGYRTGVIEIDKIIEERDSKINNIEEYKNLDDKAQDMIVKDFLDKKLLTKENLEGMNMHSVQSRRKNINKENGYRASHSTICDNEYHNINYEVQGKTKYVEEITHDGAADHSKRYGKKRVIPEELMDEHDVQEIQKSVPQYYIFRPGMKDLYKCNFIENTYYYYQNEFIKDDKLLEKLWDVDIREQ